MIREWCFMNNRTCRSVSQSVSRSPGEREITRDEIFKSTLQERKRKKERETFIPFIKEEGSL